MRGKLGWGLVYVSDICEGCQNSVESLLHLFRVCQEIKLLWQFFIRVESGGNFYVCDNWEQWSGICPYHFDLFQVISAEKNKHTGHCLHTAL